MRVCFVLLPSLKMLSWEREAILCFKALLSTFRSSRCWSRNATRGDNIETSAYSLYNHIIKTLIKQVHEHTEIIKLQCKITCNVLILCSSSVIYCSFLTRDLRADCLFAKILCVFHEKMSTFLHPFRDRIRLALNLPLDSFRVNDSIVMCLGRSWLIIFIKHIKCIIVG